MTNRVRRVLLLAISLLVHGTLVGAQTVYHLHKEPVDDFFTENCAYSLKTPTGPDAPLLAILSPDLKNHAAGLMVLTCFETFAGVHSGGTIPQNSTVTFRLWMKKTNPYGVVYPQATLRLASGAQLCSATGGTALSTTFPQDPFTFSCTTSSAIPFGTTDRPKLYVGYNIATVPGNHSVKVELDIETGFDSQITVPNPVPPIITSIDPPSGPVNWPVTIHGTLFGSTGAVKFGPTTATTTSWTDDTIIASVPASLTVGSAFPVTVAVGGTSSSCPGNNCSFTVIGPPSITSVTPTAAHRGDSVSIAGTNFMSPQASSSVTFGGVPSLSADTTTWNNTTIVTKVPPTATAGPIVVSVANQASNSLAFTVVLPGSISGTISKAVDSTPLQGATVQAVLTGVIKGTATSAANGTYAVGNLDPGTYDLRVLASGYSSEVRSVALANGGTSTADVAMSHPGSISGQVTAGGTPLPGAAVTMFLNGMQQASGQTDSSGNYSLGSLHPGSYTLQVVDVGYRTKEQGVVVTDSANTTADVSLDAAPAGPVSYAYDAIGRLIQVTDPSGDAAIYHYDSVGNITSIERPGANVVSLSGFTPTKGPVAASVTIYGTGFSTTSANTITFGSGQASATATTPNQLTVTVPSGANTSQIGISNMGGSGVSTDTFTVTDAALGAPTITGFAPAIGVSGTVVTITGTNFETTAANDRLTANLTFMNVSTATSTSLTAPIPTAGSGPITVSTPAGSAVSTTDLFIAPPPYTADLVEFTRRMSIGDTQIVTVGTANHIGLVTFSGTAGQRVSLVGTDGLSGYVVGCDVNVSLLTPYGTPLGPMTCMEGSSAFLDVQTLRATGTYTILIAPVNPAHGSVTLKLVNVPADFTAAIPTDGTEVTVETTTPGQNARLTFAGTAGQHISLLGTNGIHGQVALVCDVDATIIAPDGTPVAGGTACMEDTGFIDSASLPAAGLPASGTYTILVNPAEAAWGNVTFSLHTVTDVSDTINADGVAKAVLIQTAGQNARLTFSGTALQWVSLEGGGISGQINLTCDVTVSILKPDNGGVLVSPTCVEGYGFVDAIQLPTTGTYTIVVDPAGPVTGTVTLNLHTVTDFSGTIVADGSPVLVPLNTPGENGSLTFSGTALQWVTLATSGMSGQIAFTCDVNASILKPANGGVLVPPTCVEGDGVINAVQLPTTGTYTIVIDPVSYVRGTITLTLSTTANAPVSPGAATQLHRLRVSPEGNR